MIRGSFQEWVKLRPKDGEELERRDSTILFSKNLVVKRFHKLSDCLREAAFYKLLDGVGPRIVPEHSVQVSLLRHDLG